MPAPAGSPRMPDRSASAAAFGEPAQQQLVTAGFQLAAALFDRALGLDRNLARLQPTIPYDDSSAGWNVATLAWDRRDGP